MKVVHYRAHALRDSLGCILFKLPNRILIGLHYNDRALDLKFIYKTIVTPIAP